MILRRHWLRRVAGVGLALAVALGFLGVEAGTASPAFAATGQFHGLGGDRTAPAAEAVAFLDPAAAAQMSPTTEWLDS